MKETVTIDLRDDEARATASPVRKLLHMVLLLAVKDRASEVRFDPVEPGQRINLASPPWDAPDEGIGQDASDALPLPLLDSSQICRLRYLVAGVFHDLVPPPIPMDAIVREVMALAKVDPVHRPLLHLLRWIGKVRGARPGPVEARMRILLGSETVEVMVGIYTCEELPRARRIVLRLPDPSRASEEAQQVLSGYLAWATAQCNPA